MKKLAEIFSFPISVQRIENTLISIISPSRTCYKSLALSKVTSAKNSVKSIPEELAEQSREHYSIEKNNKNQRKESGASAQTSASGQSAQTWDPTSGHRRGSAAVSIVSQKRRKASLPEYFPTSSRYVLAKGLHQVHKGFSQTTFTRGGG